MGIINVTPDSFFDGGRFHTQDEAIKRGFALLEEGAHILDIGGESTRPYAKTISVEEEIRRAVPVIKELSSHGFVSIDTRRAKVMEKAIEAGARMVNDVSALTYDADSLNTVKDAGCKVILMHSQGDSSNMQDNPTYSNPEAEIFDYLMREKEKCVDAGMKEENIYVDPGIGFGKLKEHNFWILNNLEILCKKSAVLLGASRKSFLAESKDNPADRLSQSLAISALAKHKGVRILRVHDVAETRKFLSVYDQLTI